jgi:hypothetical protein
LREGVIKPSSATLLAMVGKVSSDQGCGGELGDVMLQLRGPKAELDTSSDVVSSSLQVLGRLGW